MTSHQTRAVILKHHIYGESDKIVTALTADYGKIRGIAKGARSSQKRFGASLDVGSLVELRFQESPRELFFFQEAVTLVTDATWRRSLASLTAVSTALEWLDAFVKDHQLAPEKFLLISHFLETVQAETALSQLVAFEKELLIHSGLRLSWEECVECHDAQTKGNWRFDPDRGGLLCQRCHGGRGIVVDYSKIKAGDLPLCQKLLEHAFYVTVGRNLKSAEALHEFIL